MNKNRGTDISDIDIDRDEKTRRSLWALRIYKTKYGNLDVPYAFVVPEQNTSGGNESWPSSLQGLKLGRTVADWRFKMRSGRFGASLMEELNKLNFNETRTFFFFRDKNNCYPSQLSYYIMNMLKPLIHSDYMYLATGPYSYHC